MDIQFREQDHNDSIDNPTSSRECFIEENKVYVNGFSRETTHQDLEDYFMQFGEVTEVLLFTSSPQIFAFVSFARNDSVDSVLNSNPQNIKGDQVEVKYALVNLKVRRIYVLGLGEEITDDDIFNYFNNFGMVQKVEFAVSTSNERSCFVTFEDGVTVGQVCRLSKHKIGSRICDVKKATAKQYNKAFKNRLQGRTVESIRASWRPN